MSPLDWQSRHCSLNAILTLQRRIRQYRSCRQQRRRFACQSILRTDFVFACLCPLHLDCQGTVLPPLPKRAIRIGWMECVLLESKHWTCRRSAYQCGPAIADWCDQLFRLVKKHCYFFFSHSRRTEFAALYRFPYKELYADEKVAEWRIVQDNSAVR